MSICYDSSLDRSQLVSIYIILVNPLQNLTGGQIVVLEKGKLTFQSQTAFQGHGRTRTQKTQLDEKRKALMAKPSSKPGDRTPAQILPHTLWTASCAGSCLPGLPLSASQACRSLGGSSGTACSMAEARKGDIAEACLSFKFQYVKQVITVKEEGFILQSKALKFR